ncbi:MAG: ATP-binding domain-containing protein, partial [Bulleidia sp.]|nr:ATP-binding domain-containing protein [Bulleidia sp.]
VHKSQGSEYPIVIMPFAKNQWIMLNKKLIYTAITRCKNTLILIGNKEVFFQGCNVEERHQRNTKLVQKILTFSNNEISLNMQIDDKDK